MSVKIQFLVKMSWKPRRCFFQRYKLLQLPHLMSSWLLSCNQVFANNQGLHVRLGGPLGRDKDFVRGQYGSKINSVMEAWEEKETNLKL